MPGANVRLVGFEGKLYWGASPGTTGATELTIARDVSYKVEATKGDVSDRADINEYDRTAMVKTSLEFEVNNKTADSFIAAARTCATTGVPMPLRTRDKTSGFGCDGDFNLSLDESQPLKDAQRIKVTATPTNEYRALTWS